MTCDEKVVKEVVNDDSFNPYTNNYPIEEDELEDNLFVLSVTLSNGHTYLVEVKKNVGASAIAERFCRENDMQGDQVIKEELTALLSQYIE